MGHYIARLRSTEILIISVYCGNVFRHFAGCGTQAMATLDQRFPGYNTIQNNKRIQKTKFG